MNEKLKKIAIRLEDTIEFFETPQDVYDELMSLSKKQTDYFQILGAENIIKLTFLIFSHKKTNSFELGEKLLNDSMFLFTIFSEGDNHRERCEVCGGDGQVECNVCDGVGEVPCEECGESGEVPCETCEGTGVDPENEEESCWDCNGAGNKTCTSCYGETMETCPECHASRLEPCQECDEIGEIETDDWDYAMETILTWDSQLISKSIEFENTLVPIIGMNDYNLLYRNYIVIRHHGDEYMEFRKGFKAKEIYCFGHDDNPQINLSSQGIVPSMPWSNLKNYGQ
jgi:hypothetical protein